MVNRVGKHLKFRGKGAGTRHMVPFAYDLSMEMEAASPSTHNKTIVDMMKDLVGFYGCFGQSLFDTVYSAICTRQLLLLYSALTKEADIAGQISGSYGLSSI